MRTHSVLPYSALTVSSPMRTHSVLPYALSPEHTQQRVT